MPYQRIKFYQTGSFAVGNRLLDPGQRSVQSRTEHSNTLTCGHRACQGRQPFPGDHGPGLLPAVRDRM